MLGNSRVANALIAVGLLPLLVAADEALAGAALVPYAQWQKSQSETPLRAKRALAKRLRYPASQVDDSVCIRVARVL
jgi:hypothetical protein